MRLVKWIAVLLITVSPFHANGQDIKFAGTHPPDSAVIDLFENYFAKTYRFETVTERDTEREDMVSAGYFYHDMDGMVIDFESLTARQSQNSFTLENVVKFNVTFHQYQHTAIVSHHYFVRGNDRGDIFEWYGSSSTVILRENDEWKVAADINGREPYIPNPPPGLPPQRH